MKFHGLIKVIIFLLIDYFVIYNLLGFCGSIVIIIAILIYAFCGEYIELFKIGAIDLNDLPKYDKDRLIQIQNHLSKEVKDTLDYDITNMKLHVIPSDEINAFCYGIKNIAITRAAYDTCDDMMLYSVLMHEISHMIYFDTIVKRIAFANITLIFFMLTVYLLISSFFLWIIFIILCLFGLCKGFVSYLIFNGIRHVIKGVFTTFQYIILFIYNAIMAMVSRSSEYRADKLSWTLGYGDELSYFLQHFQNNQNLNNQTILDIIYASHPPTSKRIMRLENYDKEKLAVSNLKR